ncbi:UNVERIFIED_CONTAM: hypothetical protein GTU68_005219, partial [Idotea baltica]|nr:hypothetical protein [Idotea baltica]
MLEVVDLRKHFGGVRSLDGARLSVKPGTVHALLGENGAGKSTLLKCLSGVYSPDAGTIQLEGRAYAPRSPFEAEAAGLRFVHQELNLVAGFTACESAFVGRRYPRKFGLIDRKVMVARMREATERFGLDVPILSPVRSLSVGQRQLVEILRALMNGARLLVLDEPTASLSEAEARILREVITNLAGSGCAVIFVSHRMEEVFEVAQDYTVLRNGKTVGQGLIADVGRSDLVGMMAGSEYAQQHRTEAERDKGQTVLTLENFSVGPEQASFNLEVGAHEVVGLYGIVGSGRSNLLRSIWGANPIARGQMTVGQQSLPGSGIEQRVRAGVAYACEDR